MRTPFALCILGVVMLHSMSYFTSGLATAQTATSEEESTVPEGDNETKPSLGASLLSKTAGGTQLWTDHLYRGEFRIQQNVLTGHWRLLDANDVRRTWGTRAECETLLDDLQPKTSPECKAGRVAKACHRLAARLDANSSFDETARDETRRSGISRYHPVFLCKFAKLDRRSCPSSARGA